MRESRNGSVVSNIFSNQVCMPLHSDLTCANVTPINIARQSFPSSLTNIGQWAFCRCDSIKELMLPESLASLERSAFAACSSLKKLILPISISEIGSSAFSNCDVLEEIYYSATNPIMASSDIFFRCDVCKCKTLCPKWKIDDILSIDAMGPSGAELLFLKIPYR